ncbi:hypothetical protein OBBRIDRAFT_623969 [Obba rivulosa]|uniref:Uncharacterized protein n=1 Tax=Obba rivulosa TaxID=1052685 RepID=A0A8E2AXP8_9APHY|nr:hypothetical protein OBBRIDRAFT_623969 [Obba rivulosa]
MADSTSRSGSTSVSRKHGWLNIQGEQRLSVPYCDVRDSKIIVPERCLDNLQVFTGRPLARLPARCRRLQGRVWCTTATSPTSDHARLVLCDVVAHAADGYSRPHPAAQPRPAGAPWRWVDSHCISGSILQSDSDISDIMSCGCLMHPVGIP